MITVIILCVVILIVAALVFCTLWPRVSRILYAHELDDTTEFKPNFCSCRVCSCGEDNGSNGCDGDD